MHFPARGFAGVMHIHPHQDERFEVLAGQAQFLVDGERRVLGAGESIDVPAGTAHTFANGGPDEMRVIGEFRPGLDCTERFYELYFAFAQEGRVNAKAMPSLSVQGRDDLTSGWLAPGDSGDRRERAKQGVLDPCPTRQHAPSISSPESKCTATTSERAVASEHGV
jgi:hypothetical protein